MKRKFAQMVLMLVVALVLSSCAAVQPALAQEAETVKVVTVNQSQFLAALGDAETLIFTKPFSKQYVVSFFQDGGRVFVFAIRDQVLPKGLWAGAERTSGMIQQFVRDGWLSAPIMTSAFLENIARVGMPTIIMLPVTPEFDLQNYLPEVTNQ